MKYFHFTLLAIGLLLFSSSCGDDDQISPSQQLALDIDIIQDYLTDNNLTAQSTPSGLHYIIEETGTGNHPVVEELVVFEFVGIYADGSTFGESIGPEIFDLSVIIDGFKEGIPLFEIGGKGKLLLPSALAFGPSGAGNVPPNAVMIFDVVLPEVCLDETDFVPKQKCLDNFKIDAFLADSSLVAESTPSGLHYIIEEEGIGGFPTLDDVVHVNYKGYLLNGEVFDQTTGTPAVFLLSNVIAGWREGIRLFKKGGKGTLYIPSDLGYGSSPPAGIPANNVLIFEVELVDF